MRASFSLLPILLSCALSHQVPGQSDGGVDGNGGLDANVDVCVSLPAERVSITVGEVFSATFVGAYLHLEAEFDGVRRYAIAEVHGQDLRVLNYTRLEGPANWVEADSAGVEHYARARIEDDGLVVETLDARSPLAPSVADVLLVAIPRAPHFARFFSVQGERLYFCLPATEPPEVFSPGGQGAVSLSTLEYEGLIRTPACADPSGFLREGVSVSWHPEGLARAHRLADTSEIASYNYNPDGIHQYGSVIHAATDGATVVLDTENSREFFLFRLNETDTREGNFSHAYFPAANGGRLLDVVDSTAYFATASGLIAYATLPDVWMNPEWARPARKEWSMSGELDLESLKPLASSFSELVVVEGDTGLMIAPLDGSATELRRASIHMEMLPPNPCR